MRHRLKELSTDTFLWFLLLAMLIVVVFTGAVVVDAIIHPESANARCIAAYGEGWRLRDTFLGCTNGLENKPI